MQIPERKLRCLAEAIHQQLQRLQASRYGEVIRRTQSLIASFGELRRLSDLLTTSLGRNWNAAAADVTDRIVQNLRDLPYHTGEIQQMVESARRKLPTLQDILADLRQAQEEFDDFRYVKDDQLLVVKTESIELEDHYFGEFEIQLRLGNLAEMKRHSSTYRIVALDPHPASCNEAVTHPHVSDEHLCEGDAGSAIESALTNGRICDFFQLVHSVLTTYNPRSPFVSLDDWEGRPCHDCGYTMHSDNSSWCTSCEEDFCEDCSSYCRSCDETTCLGCLQNCEACNDPVCPSCMTTCPDCGRSICKSCKDEVLCPCVKENEENEDDSDQDNGTEAGRAEGDGAKAPGTQAA
jgi:hypothetical protein